MHKTFSLVSGASLGAGLMYLFDPDRGRRRRALIREKGNRWSRETQDFAGSASRDMRNRAIGMGVAVRSWVQPDAPVPDQVLAERVRAKLGLFSGHPSAIDVHVKDGVVTLTGPVLEDEMDGICAAIGKIPGVVQMFNRLERHRSPEFVPELQGGAGQRTGPRFAFMQSHWSPSARMAAALMGTAAVFYGLKQRTMGATTLAASGLGLLVRSATNQELSRLCNFKEKDNLEEAA